MHLKILTWRICLLVVLVSAYLASGVRRGGKNALQHVQMTTVCEGKSSPILWILVLRRERHQAKETERRDVEAYCMCEPMETAQSLWR